MRTTRKETPRCVTPIHLPHAAAHARRRAEPRARLRPSGRGAAARGHRGQRGRRSGAELRPGAPRVPGGSWRGAVSSASENRSFPRLGAAFLTPPGTGLPPQGSCILNTHSLLAPLCNFFPNTALQHPTALRQLMAKVEGEIKANSVREVGGSALEGTVVSPMGVSGSRPLSGPQTTRACCMHQNNWTGAFCFSTSHLSCYYYSFPGLVVESLQG